MPLVSISIPHNAAEIAKRLEDGRRSVQPAMRAGLDAANVTTVAYIQEHKLTAAGPTFLNVRTGRLRRSARATRAANFGANGVRSTVGSNVSYAAAHEYGARAHKITASGKALRFQPGGKSVFQRGKGFIFRKSVNIPALPARRPFGSGVDDMVNNGTYSAAISDAILKEFLP